MTTPAPARGPGAAARFARTVVLTLTLAAAAAMVVAGVAGARLLPVLTGSMTPYAPAGSLVLTVPLPGSDVAVGDVIAFRPPMPYQVSDDRPILHRVAELGSRDGTPFLRTRGDANPAEDPWQVATADAHFGRAVLVVPHLGRLLAGGPVAGIALPFGAAALLVGLGALRRTPAQSTGPGRPSSGEPDRQTVTVAVAVPAAEWDPDTGARHAIRARRALDRAAGQLGLALTDAPVRTVATTDDGTLTLTLTAAAARA